MEWLWETGIALILALQALGGWLEAPMKFFSFLGSEEFFLLVMPVLYWSVSAELGLRVGVTLLVTGALNDALKMTFHGPRPYWYDPAVQPYAAETSFGVPSGHAQIATGVWGMLAASLKRRWAWAVAVFVIFMIGFSRLYLGVHFLHDVLAGWLFGALILAALLGAWEPIATRVKTLPLSRQIGLAFGASLLLVAASLIPYLSLQSWQIPQNWIANATAFWPEEPPHPVTLNSTLSTAGTLFGLLTGLAWLNTRGGFSARGTTTERVLRYALGVLGVGVLWFGLGAIFPRGDELLPYILRFVRYSLVGLWVSAGAPWLFIKLKWARGLQI
jgi:membrane-associated phospholipid phosphatase